jgi:hypothetical protein
MIVVDPYDIVWAQDLHDGITEALIYFFIISPITLIVRDIGCKIVKKWPDSFIAESMIEFVHGTF